MPLERLTLTCLRTQTYVGDVPNEWNKHADWFSVWLRHYLITLPDRQMDEWNGSKNGSNRCPHAHAAGEAGRPVVRQWRSPSRKRYFKKNTTKPLFYVMKILFVLLKPSFVGFTKVIIFSWHVPITWLHVPPDESCYKHYIYCFSPNSSKSVRKKV